MVIVRIGLGLTAPSGETDFGGTSTLNTSVEIRRAGRSFGTGDHGERTELGSFAPTSKQTHSGGKPTNMSYLDRSSSNINV